MKELYNVESYYNLIAEEYAQQYFKELDRKPFDRIILQRFSELVKDSGKVCDLGCGPGEIARFLKDLGVDVFGIDLSKEMIIEARRLSPDIEFQQGNMLSLDMQNNSLAGITAFYAIVNFTLNMVRSAIWEFKRVLAPAGYLLISFHIGSNEEVNVEKTVDDIKATVGFTFFNSDEIIKMLEEADFTIDEAIIRYPYKDAEYQSKRAYILARKTV